VGGGSEHTSAGVQAAEVLQEQGEGVVAGKRAYGGEKCMGREAVGAGRHRVGKWVAGQVKHHSQCLPKHA